MHQTKYSSFLSLSSPSPLIIYWKMEKLEVSWEWFSTQCTPWDSGSWNWTFVGNCQQIFAIWTFLVNWSCTSSSPPDYENLLLANMPSFGENGSGATWGLTWVCRCIQGSAKKSVIDELSMRPSMGHFQPVLCKDLSSFFSETCECCWSLLTLSHIPSTGCT